MFEGKEWQAVSSDAIALITAMLTYDHVQRPGAEALLTHKWFQIQEGLNDGDSNPIGSLMMDRLRQFGGMQRMKRLALTCLVRTLNNRDVKSLLVRLSPLPCEEPARAPLPAPMCARDVKSLLVRLSPLPYVPGTSRACSCASPHSHVCPGWSKAMAGVRAQPAQCLGLATMHIASAQTL